MHNDKRVIEIENKKNKKLKRNKKSLILMCLLVLVFFKSANILYNYIEKIMDEKKYYVVSKNIVYPDIADEEKKYCTFNELISIINEKENLDINEKDILDVKYVNLNKKIMFEPIYTKKITNIKKIPGEYHADVMQNALNYINSLPDDPKQNDPSLVPIIGGSQRAKAIYLIHCLEQSEVVDYWGNRVYPEIEYINEKRYVTKDVQHYVSIRCDSSYYEIVPGYKNIR